MFVKNTLETKLYNDTHLKRSTQSSFGYIHESKNWKLVLKCGCGVKLNKE